MAPSVPHQNNKIALLCRLHTASPSANKKVVELLSSARSYYTTEAAKCTTWSYCSPSTRPKAPSQFIPSSEKATTIFGIEIYTETQALSAQQQEDWFVDFQNRVKSDDLYAQKGEELTAWYPIAGFVARETVATPYGGIVMFALFTCRQGRRDSVADVLARLMQRREYTSYVLEKESGVLTYCILTRPKAPNELLMFERYQDHKALAAHGGTKEFRSMFKRISADIDMQRTKLQELQEWDNAFVGNVVGGAMRDGNAPCSKL